MGELFRRATIAVMKGIAGATLVWSSAALAQGEPPARVGRLAFINGAVSFHDDAESAWTQAVVNTPITTGDAIWTEPNARSEISLAGTRIRLEGASELDMLALDDSQTRMRLSQGRIDIKTVSFDPSQPYQIVTPRGTISLLQQGDYYIEAGSLEDPTRLGVRSGAAQIESLNGQVLAVRAGEVGEVLGDASMPQLRTVSAPPPAPPAFWANRDRQVVYDQAPQYIPAGARGPECLRQLGKRRQLWNGLGAARGARRVGAVSHRPLGLSAALGLDVDRRAAVGLRAVSLRPLGQPQQSLDVGAATARHAASLRAGASGFRWRRRIGREPGRSPQRAGRLVPVGTARSLCAGLHDEPRLLSAYQSLGCGPGSHAR